MSIAEIIYKQNEQIDISELEKLYQDAGWTNYTADLAKLNRAYENSAFVASAWDGSELVGVIRAIGDEETIIYIQDILVLKSYQRQGIGKRLLMTVLEKYEDVRQKVLLTDETCETVAFYESVGFKKCQSMGLVSFVKLEKV